MKSSRSRESLHSLRSLESSATYSDASGQDFVVTKGDFRFQAHPHVLLCPHCKELVKSSLDYEIGEASIIAAFVLFWVMLPLFWLPFLLNSFKDVIHSCPKCSNYLGHHARI